jgi:hypothetical protein
MLFFAMEFFCQNVVMSAPLEAHGAVNDVDLAGGVRRLI